MPEILRNRLSLLERSKYLVQRYSGHKVCADLRPYIKTIDQINHYRQKYHRAETLLEAARDLARAVCSGADLDTALIPVFALVAEACRRHLGLDPFPVQLAAGVAMHQGRLVQMQTGEGKTLAAVFPAVLNALQGKGVHIMTANDYLAQRDACWMGPVYRSLGLDVAWVGEGMDKEARKAAYKADITYVTAREAGFDFLRDQLAYSRDDQVQRPFQMALVDEADFILIDEARIPLVIAGADQDQETDACRINALLPRLQEHRDYVLDPEGRSVFLTESGQDRVARLLDIKPMFVSGNSRCYAAVVVALHAHHLLQRDVDYIVRRGRIELVDAFTGRVADKRRWPHGIQTALEAKEGLPLQQEGRIYGSITIQHFINLYPRLAGMTATALSAVEELADFYGLDVVLIPPHKPGQRIDAPDMVFTNYRAKMQAVLEEVVTVHGSGRPILVGTTSVRESQHLAEQLQARGVPCKVLNAAQDAHEAELVAQAGTLGAVTIATNMAGRGTDILLGGPQAQDRDDIVALGGLYIIGTNRHESIRVDNQLRGRAGRQGDPGLSRFFISLEDELMEKYGVPEFLPGSVPGKDTQEPITDPRVLREILRAQRIIEDQNYQIRHTLRKYSELVERQRRCLAAMRRQCLETGSVPEMIQDGCRAKFRELCQQLGTEETSGALVRMCLIGLDRFWADHLAGIEDLREGIHLARFGGREPLFEFMARISESFDQGLEQACRDIVTAFNKLQIVGNKVDLAAQGIKGPSSTWTYLINDNPLPGFKLGLIADGNIGFAAMAVLPMIFIMPLKALATRVKRWLQRGRSG